MQKYIILIYNLNMYYNFVMPANQICAYNFEKMSSDGPETFNGWSILTRDYKCCG